MMRFIDVETKLTKRLVLVCLLSTALQAWAKRL